MNAIELYKDEINNQNTRYFILDTSGPGEYGDIDFIQYQWDKDKFNKVRGGDIFIYRRTSKSSEIKNQFYFFGSGRIGSVKFIGKVRLQANIEKPYIFKNKLLRNDLENFKWRFKERGTTWSYFFNQYGMNQITKEDFINILSLQSTDVSSDYSESIVVELYQQQQKENYRVEDNKSNVNIRGAAQKVFADQVKINYNYKCAITGITTKDFLIASHIIPWSVDKDNRINPKNGICLSTLVDRAFDKGYITFSDQYRVIISNRIKEDPELYNLLKVYENVKIRVNPKFEPELKFLRWHRENIFT